MLFLKIKAPEETKYLKFSDEDFVSLKKVKKLKLPIEGDIEFYFVDNRWHFTNKTDIKIKYRHRKVKINYSKRLKFNKPIYYKDVEITSLEYKSGKVKPVSPGLINSKIDLSTKSEFTIGRDPNCDIVIDNPQVDLVNTRIFHDDEVYYIEDVNSANGLKINGKKVKNKILENYDTFMLPGAVYMFVNNTLLQSISNDGIRIDVRHIYKQVKDFETHKNIYLVNDVSLTINQGEYVAIVGGSGAGKSTFLDCVNGRRPMTSGKIYYDLNNYYEFFDSYQKIVGYVPQSDIMHTDLSVYKTLYYYAQIKMYHHLNKTQLNELILKVLTEVSLLEKKDVIVSSLSGGQKKRVSIAMELLANPKVIFLDEPTSGLSPDLDYELMTLLKKLKDQGKTIIIITHNMENVDKCDKIAFLGKGGKLCYFGKPSEIFKYFGVKKYGQIFSLLQDSKNVDLYVEKLKNSESYQKMMAEQDEIYKGVED